MRSAREVAYIAVMCALLIGGQYVFSFVAGVEIVTVLLISFACVFGVRCGVFCAAAFSVLRCLIYGFYPNVVILYLIYYPLLAAAFGGLGHIKDGVYKNYPVWFAAVINAVLLLLAATCAVCAVGHLIKVSKLIKRTITILLWVIFGLCALMLAAFDGLIIAGKLLKKDLSTALKVITFASLAAVCTACFTLLDDAITPLVLGYTRLTTLAYFYASFTAMLPHVVCTLATTLTLFLPITTAMKKSLSLK